LPRGHEVPLRGPLPLSPPLGTWPSSTSQPPQWQSSP